MPIDASIPLSGRPVQPVQDPLEGYGRMISLQSLMQQRQMQDQQLRSAQLENQVRERAISEEDAFRAALGRGAQAAELMQISPRLATAHIKATSEQAKAERDAKKAQLELFSKQAERLGAIAGSMSDEATYRRGITLARSEDLIDDNAAQQLLAMPWNAETQAMVKQFGTQAMDAKAQHDTALADLKNERDAEEHKAKMPGVRADADTKIRQNAAAQLGSATTAEKYAQIWGDLPARVARLFPAPEQFDPKVTPGQVRTVGMTPDQQNSASQATATRVETARHNRVTESQGAQRIGMERERMAKETAFTGAGGSAATVTGDAYLQTLDPSLAKQVKALAEGRMQFPSGFALKSEYWQNLLRAVGQYDPSFDATQYNVRSGVRKDFTSGKAANNIRSLNTVIGHLENLSKAADELNNTRFTSWNRLANWTAAQTGDPRIKRFLTAKEAVIGELATAFKGTATEGEIARWKESIDAADSPKQLNAAVDEAIRLLGSRVSALRDQYEQGMKKAPDFQLLNKESRKILKRLGKNPDEIDPSGSTAAAGVGPDLSNVSTEELLRRLK